MNDTDRLSYEQYSSGEITRDQLAQRLGRDITPAEAIISLGALGLPLPKVTSPVDSPGRKLLRALLALPSPHG